MERTLILIKQAEREFLKLLHPTAVNPLKIGGRVVPNNVVFSLLGFIFLYFMSVVVLTFTLVISGSDFVSACSGITACINNAGPGLGILGPVSNYGILSDFQTWVCTLAMPIGRLEIVTVLIIFTPHFWRRQPDVS
jgi:trk system potassium uptake protein TrkH